MHGLISSTFPLSVVAEATGMKDQTIKSHIQRGNVTGEGDRILGGGGPGKRRAYSFHTVMELRAARVLIDMGFHAEQSFLVAQSFAHSGTTSAAFVGQKEPVCRLPSLPFHYVFGESFICFDGSKSRTILQMKVNGQLECLDVALKRNRKYLSGDTMLTVNAWSIFNDVVRVLGGDPFEVADSAYRIFKDSDLDRFDFPKSQGDHSVTTGSI